MHIYLSLHDPSIDQALIGLAKKKKKKNPILVIYILQRRHGQFFGIHFLTMLLKLDSEFASLIFCGTSFHNFTPRFVMDSVA